MKAPLRTLFASILTLALFQVQSKEYEEIFDVAAGGTLTLKTSMGSIQVESHSADTVLMQVDVDGLDEDEFVLEHQVSGADLEIIGKTDNKRGWYSKARVKFRLVVPEIYNLDMQTSGGSIEIEDLTGDIEANTSGGSLSAENINGNVDMHTSGGSITTKAISGAIDAHTSGGSISATFADKLQDEAEFHTSGGSISVYLDNAIQVDLSASTSGGRVRSDFSVDGRVKKQSIRGKINGGGPKLKLHTSGGSVSVRAL